MSGRSASSVDISGNSELWRGEFPSISTSTSFTPLQLARCKAQAHEQELHRVRFSSLACEKHERAAGAFRKPNNCCSGRYYRS